MCVRVFERGAGGGGCSLVHLHVSLNRTKYYSANSLRLGRTGLGRIG